jgi:hypothetical protein
MDAKRSDHIMFEPNSEEMQRYFSSLPRYIQESIHQSSVEIKSMEDLKNLAENIQSGRPQN